MADRESYGSRRDRIGRVVERMESHFVSICEEEDLTTAEVLGCWLVVLLESWWETSDAANRGPEEGSPDPDD